MADLIREITRELVSGTCDPRWQIMSSAIRTANSLDNLVLESEIRQAKIDGENGKFRDPEFCFMFACFVFEKMFRSNSFFEPMDYLRNLTSLIYNYYGDGIDGHEAFTHIDSRGNVLIATIVYLAYNENTDEDVRGLCRAYLDMFINRPYMVMKFSAPLLAAKMDRWYYDQDKKSFITDIRDFDGHMLEADENEYEYAPVMQSYQFEHGHYLPKVFFATRDCETKDSLLEKTSHLSFNDLTILEMGGVVKRTGSALDFAMANAEMYGPDEDVSDLHKAHVVVDRRLRGLSFL